MHDSTRASTSATSAFEQFVEAVERATGRPRKRVGRETVLLCPVHGDHDPSLNVREGDDGTVLVQCRSQQCSYASICKAIGYQPHGDESDSWTPRGQAVAVYQYHDEFGELLFEVCRTADKQFPARRPDETSGSGWRWNLDEVRRVPYRLPELIEAVGREETVYVVEGEKDADALTEHGVAATCNPGGAGKWREEYNVYFTGADVVVVADADDPGRGHAASVAAALERVASSVAVREPAAGKDVSDHLAAGLDLDQLVSVDLADPTAASAENSVDTNAAKGGQQSLTARLVALAQEELELFSSPDGEAYACCDRDGHRESWSLQSKQFRQWLHRLAWTSLNSALTSYVSTAATAVLEGLALYDAPVRPVYQRVGELDDLIYLDLGDQAWTTVTISADGWAVTDDGPVAFRRTAGNKQLPLPVRGGELERDLRPFLNVDDDGWKLFCSWLVAALRPRGPYPILDLSGEQGSAKSTTARIARSLVDPNKAQLRSLSKDDRDLMIAATNGWVLAFDNISGISQALSDALCRLATGGGFATRELYTNTDETIIDAQRPIILNGIGEHALRSDLLDRTLTVELAPIPDTERRTDRELWAAFDEAQPRILGALLDAVVVALRDEHTVDLPNVPRMADFAIWAAAAAPALGWDAEAFLETYTRSRGNAHISAIEASPVGPALRKIGLSRDGFSGTPTELLQRLLAEAGQFATNQKGWPSNAQALSTIIKRLQPDLREIGIDVDYVRSSTQRTIILRPINPPEPAEPATTSADADDAVDDPGTTATTADETPVLSGRGGFQQMRESLVTEEQNAPSEDNPDAADPGPGEAPPTRAQRLLATGRALEAENAARANKRQQNEKEST